MFVKKKVEQGQKTLSTTSAFYPPPYFSSFLALLQPTSPTSNPPAGLSDPTLNRGTNHNRYTLIGLKFGLKNLPIGIKTPLEAQNT